MRTSKLDFGIVDGMRDIARRDGYSLGYLYVVTGNFPGGWPTWAPTKDMYLNHFTLRLA